MLTPQKKFYLLIFSSLFIFLLGVGLFLEFFRPSQFFNKNPTEPKLPSDSVYWLDGTWKSSRETSFPLSSLQGQPVVFAFIYANCKTICPAVSGALIKLDKNLRPNSFWARKSKTKIIVVSLDPEHDTPASLKTFVEKTGTLSTEWIFLVGTETSTRELATLFGMRYRKLNDGEISHSVGVSLVDSQGRLIYQVDSLSGQERDFANHVFETR